MKWDLRLTSTNKTDIIENIMNSFSAMYLTMISIVQGIALGILFYKVSALVSSGAIFSTFAMTAYALITIVTTFIFIILTWHSYFWLAAVARWVPLIWDSILFFIFGAFEFMLIESLSSLDTFAWFYLFAIVGFVGGVQYLYNSKRLRDKKRDKEKDKKETTEVYKYIWDIDSEKVGNHISTYKKSRGKMLMILCFVFIFIVLGMDYSFIPYMSLFSTVTKQLALAIIIFAIHIRLIISHLSDQKKTIKLLLGVE